MHEISSKARKLTGSKYGTIYNVVSWVQYTVFSIVSHITWAQALAKCVQTRL